MQTQERERSTETVEIERQPARKRSNRPVVALIGAVVVAGSVGFGLLVGGGERESPATNKSEVPTPIVTVPGPTGEYVTSPDGS